MTDIHDYETRLRQALDSVSRSPKLSSADKESLLKFSRSFRRSASQMGVTKYMSHLSVIAERLPEITQSTRGLSDASKETSRA